MNHFHKSKLFIVFSALISSSLYAANCQMPPVPMHDSLKAVCEEANADASCTILWKGYRWWLDYNAIPDPQSNPWWIRFNWAQGQGYDPRNIRVNNGELQMNIGMSDLGGGKQEWNSAEAVLVADSNGNPFSVGYGEYYAVIETVNGFAYLDKNSVFGLFTYFKGDNGERNPHNEIDIAEISKWGGKTNVEQTNIDPALKPIMYNEPGFESDAHGQVGLQPWDTWISFGNFQKFPISSSIKVITTYMYWNGKEGEKKIHIKIFEGNTPFSQVKEEKGTVYDWETSSKNEKFIPNDEDCTRLHINFYLQNTHTKQPHLADPPDAPQQITIKDFMYVPLK